MVEHPTVLDSIPPREIWVADVIYWSDLPKFLNLRSSLGVFSLLMRRFQHGSFLPGCVQRNQGRKWSFSCIMQRLELAGVMEKLCSRAFCLIWPFKKTCVSLHVMSLAGEEIITCEENRAFPCALCRNNAIKMFKATVPVYNVLLSWQLLPEALELIGICLYSIFWNTYFIKYYLWKWCKINIP